MNGELLMGDKIERNWLIRTRSMQILGPVSLEKVLELIDKKSLREEDEVSSGNGYWFSVREEELVERYLKQGQAQGFNPIAEAKSVLVHDVEPAPAPEKSERRKVEEEIVAPAQEDLEYPDMAISLDELPEEELPPEPVLVLEEDEDEDEEREDITMVASDLQMPVKEEPAPAAPSIPEPLKQPEVSIEKPVTKPAAKAEETAEIPVVATKKAQKKSKAGSKRAGKNDSYLFVLLALVLCLIIGVVYYYRTILNRPLPGFETSWLIDSAHAQNALLTTATKKKIL